MYTKFVELENWVLTPNSRSYLAQFTQPDTIIPNPYDSQSWNRYTYVRYNPVKYTDPTGHYCGEVGECYQSSMPLPLVKFSAEENQEWGKEQETILKAANDIGVGISRAINRENWELWKNGDLPTLPSRVSARQAFLMTFGGPVTFNRVNAQGDDDAWGEAQFGTTTINVFSNASADEIISHLRWAVHEMNHAFENRMYQTMNMRPARNAVPENLLSREPDFGGFHGGYLYWQFNLSLDSGEILADMFIGWVYNSWEMDAYGNPTTLAMSRSEFMSYYMPIWIDLCVSGR